MAKRTKLEEKRKKRLKQAEKAKLPKAGENNLRKSLRMMPVSVASSPPPNKHDKDAVGLFLEIIRNF